VRVCLDCIIIAGRLDFMSGGDIPIKSMLENRNRIFNNAGSLTCDNFLANRSRKDYFPIIFIGQATWFYLGS